MRISYIIFLIAATLIVALWYRKRSLLCTPLFVSYLAFTLLVEVVANILKYSFDANNLWVYNFYIYVSFPCWFWWLTEHIENKLSTNFKVMLLLFTTTIIIENVQVATIWGLDSLSFAVGTLIFVILFIIKIYKAYAITDQIIPGYQLLFYIAGLGFFVGFFFDIILYPTGLLSQPFWWGMDLDQIISRLINIYYYCALIISIIIGVPRNEQKIV